ncbi:MAG: DUF2889 domain-containing protein [Novosphingobium sp.]|nr:DUF2889 domain-containing protein [Novosphingobium sp.]
MNMETMPAPPRSTANPAPVRPANSLRRTTSIDVSWPDGTDQPRLFIGRVRDYRTESPDQPGTELDHAELRAVLEDDKTIRSISATPEPSRLQEIVGHRAGGHLRMFVREIMPELVENAVPLYLVLDDLSGSALVSNISWSMWDPSLMLDRRANMSDHEFEEMMAGRANVCWGLAEGNSGLTFRRNVEEVAAADAGELRNPDDPLGWHDFALNEGPGFRRARRMDMWRDPSSGVLTIDAAFQDSAKRADGGRTAIHEYLLRVTADPDTLEILSLVPEPRILPFWECPGAVANTQRLVGTSLDGIRDEVLLQLRGPEGCTHLNDAMRALADVPVLVKSL